MDLRFASMFIWFCSSFISYRNLSDVLWEAISTGQVISLYQGLGTKNLQSFIAQFVYFYGYSYFKRLYLERSGSKRIGTKANLIIAAAAGACTAILTQVSHCVSSTPCFCSHLNSVFSRRMCPYCSNPFIMFNQMMWTWESLFSVQRLKHSRNMTKEIHI